MTDYKTMYYDLSAKVADAVDLLTEAMQDGELKYMLAQDAPQPKLLNTHRKANTDEKD